MGVFDKSNQPEAPTADPTPTGGQVEVEQEGTEQTAGEQTGDAQSGNQEPDTTPTETDH